MSRMNATELAEIVARDKFAGDSLQGCPTAWSDRRALLEHVSGETERVERIVAALNVLIMGEGPNALATLEDCVAEMSARVEMQQGHDRASTHEAIESELHHPFAQAAHYEDVPAHDGWICGRGKHHRVGDMCDCAGPRE